MRLLGARQAVMERTGKRDGVVRGEEGGQDLAVWLRGGAGRCYKPRMKRKDTVGCRKSPQGGANIWKYYVETMRRYLLHLLHNRFNYF